MDPVVKDTTQTAQEYDAKEIKKPKQLPEKTFQLRNSVLSDLFESNRHIKTVYHMSIAVLICLFVNTTVYDYFKTNKVTIGTHLIYRGFKNIHISILTWLGIHMTAFLFYVCFNFWARVRINLSPKSEQLRIWDHLWVFTLIGFYISSFRLISYVIRNFELGQGSAAIILGEQVRLLMKEHAFMRTNVENVLRYKLHSEKELYLPEFSKFLYFLFAPTLIYRDEYPRTRTIRWDFALYRLFEAVGILFFYCFVFCRFLNPLYSDFGLRKYTWNEIIVALFESTLPGLVILLITFYLILHSIQNFFAEILRFGDRLFYEDWWTCTSYQEYFRMWNIVIQDWLYTYVYKDMYEKVTRGNKTASKIAVFILSAVVHEWMVTNMLGFFFPVMFIQFIFFGALLTCVNAPKITILNILFWYGISLGTGLMVSLYSLEFYARMNRPIEIVTWRDYLLPRWLNCDCIL